MGDALCTYSGCREPAVLMLTAHTPTGRHHQDLCLAHVGPRASEVLHEPFGGTVSVERIWEDVIAGST